MWPSCENVIQDPDRDIVFVTWGVALNAVPNADQLWPKHGLLVCLCRTHAEPILKKYEHQGGHQAIHNCTIAGDFENPMTMRALRLEH